MHENIRPSTEGLNMGTNYSHSTHHSKPIVEESGGQAITQFDVLSGETAILIQEEDNGSSTVNDCHSNRLSSNYGLLSSLNYVKIFLTKIFWAIVSFLLAPYFLIESKLPWCSVKQVAGVVDPHKLLTCNHLPNVKDALLLMLKLENCNLCPAKVMQKIGLYYYITKLEEAVLSKLAILLAKLALGKKITEELISKVMNDTKDELQKPDSLLQCGEELSVLKKENLLNTIFPKPTLDGRLSLEYAKIAFESCRCKAGILLYRIDEKTYCANLIRDENGNVKIHDATNGGDELVQYENIREVQVVVLAKEAGKAVIVEKWADCSLIFCKKELDDSHANNRMRVNKNKDTNGEEARPAKTPLDMSECCEHSVCATNMTNKYLLTESLKPVAVDSEGSTISQSWNRNRTPNTFNEGADSQVDDLSAGKDYADGETVVSIHELANFCHEDLIPNDESKRKYLWSTGKVNNCHLISNHLFPLLPDYAKRFSESTMLFLQWLWTLIMSNLPGRCSCKNIFWSIISIISTLCFSIMSKLQWCSVKQSVLSFLKWLWTLIMAKIPGHCGCKVLRVDPEKVLTCKISSCGINAILVALKDENTGLCPARVSQKIIHYLFDMRLVEITWKKLNSGWKQTEDLLSKVTSELADVLKKEVVLLSCTKVLSLLEKEKCLDVIYPKPEMDEQISLENAEKAFKLSGRKVGILLYQTDEICHCENLIRDKNGDVKIYDATTGRDDLIQFENVREMQVVVLAKEDDKFVIAEKWSDCSSIFCIKEHTDVYDKNIIGDKNLKETSEEETRPKTPSEMSEYSESSAQESCGGNTALPVENFFKWNSVIPRGCYSSSTPPCNQILFDDPQQFGMHGKLGNNQAPRGQSNLLSPLHGLLNSDQPPSTAQITPSSRWQGQPIPWQLHGYTPQPPPSVFNFQDAPLTRNQTMVQASQLPPRQT
ncbi:uncharacterized protein LOC124448276 isoform X2 [Xenia sp. Carnegie-2017]|uniref:uncharacterized protein LOC124448276 isoform X2 n=1 Tax=Xenia sp. Carnegie-2017 TaxID=2897299 RepID=UPI001F03D321|nr:uncharacterized protein LOC124448276 isoform X2 [Xenia sp. Carnegie-2017]